MAEDEEKKEKKSEEEEPPLAEPVASKSPPAKSSGPPAPPPQQQQGYYPPPPFDPARFAGNGMLFFAIVLGLILMLVGSIIIVAGPEMDEDGPTHAMTGGGILFNVGGFFLAMFLLFAGVFRNDMRDFTRLGMLIVAGFIIFKLITVVSMAQATPEIEIPDFPY